MKPETLIDEDLGSYESPRWRDGVLRLSDMHAHRVLRGDLDGAAMTVAELDGKSSGIGFLPSGATDVVSMRRRLLLRLDESAPQVYARQDSLAHAAFPCSVPAAGQRRIRRRFFPMIAAFSPVDSRSVSRMKDTAS